MDGWQKKGGTSRDRERSSWSNRDAEDESFDRSERRGVGEQYETYSVTNQASRKETAIFAKPNEPFYKYEQDSTKETKYDRNVSSCSYDNNLHRDSFSLQSRSSFSKTFDSHGEKFASEAYGQTVSVGSKRYNAQDNSNFDIEPYAVKDKNLRRESYSLQDRNIIRATYKPLDRNVGSGSYRSEDSIINMIGTSKDRYLGSRPYSSQESKLGSVPFASQDRTTIHRPLIAQDGSFGSSPYKSQDTFSGEPCNFQGKKLDSEVYRDSYLDIGRFNTKEKNLGNVPYISQGKNISSGPPVTLDSRSYDSQTTNFRNDSYIPKEIHPRGSSYNIVDKNIGERPYIPENMNVGGVSYSQGDRKYGRRTDDSEDRIPGKWHPYTENNEINLRSHRSQERDFGTKPYASQERRPGSPPHRSQEKHLGSITYVSQDTDVSPSGLYPSQSRKHDSAPYNLQERHFKSGPSYASERNANEKHFKSQQIAPSSGPYYSQDKNLNDPFISHDKSPTVSDNNWSSSSRTFYSSKPRDESITQRKSFDNQEVAYPILKINDSLHRFDKQPIAYTNKSVSYNINKSLYDNESKSYSKKPDTFVDSSRSYENKQRPHKDATSSFDNKLRTYDSRAKTYNNKRSSVETEPHSYIATPRSFDNRAGRDNNSRSFDDRSERSDNKRPLPEDVTRYLGDKPRSYDNIPDLHDREQRSDENYRSIDNRPERFEDKPPSHDDTPHYFGDKPRSYDNRTGLRDIIEKSDDHKSRSFDNRPERFDAKCLARNSELRPLMEKPRFYDNKPGVRDMIPRSVNNNQRSLDDHRSRDNISQSFSDKPRSYDNRPGLRDIEERSNDHNQRSFDDRLDRFDSKRPARNNEIRPLMEKPRFYDNKPGARDGKPRSDNNNQRSYNNRPSRDDISRPLGDKLRSYDNRPGLRDMEERSGNQILRSLHERSPLYEKHQSDDGAPRPYIGKQRSYDNTEGFRRMNPGSDNDNIQSYDNRSLTVQSHAKPKLGLKRKFKSELKPLMGEDIRFLKRDPVPPGNKVNTRKGSIAGIIRASKLIHNEVVNAYVFATCSDEDLLHKMVVYLIRIRLKKIPLANQMAVETLMKKYRNRHPSVLDHIMAEAISIRLDGETKIDTEAITPAEWKTIITQFSNVFPQEHLELLPSKTTPKKTTSTKTTPKKVTTQKVQLGKNVKVGGKKVSTQSQVSTQHPLTTDDIDSAIDTRTTDIQNVICEVAEMDSAADPVRQFVNSKILSEGAEQIKILLTRTLSKALIRPDADEEFLMLRIFGNPKLPSLQQLEKWLEPYHVRELKKSWKSKSMCIARVKDREAYEALLANNTPVVAGLPLMVKSSDKMNNPNMLKFFKNNKTWVSVVSKSQQLMKEKKRLAIANRKAAIDKAKNTRKKTNAPDIRE